MSWPAWLEPDDRRLIGLTVLIKGLILLWGTAVAVWYSGQLVGDVVGALGLWNRWDAPHYLDIAVFGYRATDPGNLVGPNGYRSVWPGDLPLYIVFYPLYPWLSGAVSAVIGQPLVAAFAVTTLASLFVAPLLYRLVRIDHGHAVGMGAAWFLLVFPTAYFLHIPYTEALFLAVVLGSFLAARSGRWWLAGLLGGLGALTRVNGLILIPALAAEAATQYFAQPAGERRLRREWLAIGGVALGYAVYLGLNQVVYGDPFEFSEILRNHWFKELALPWQGVNGVIGWLDAPDYEDAVMYGGMELLFIGLGLLGTIHAALVLRPAYFTWMALNWLLFISTSFVLSVPRYALSLFPLFITFALLTPHPVTRVLLSLASIGGLLFFAGRFAAGPWAF